MSLPAVIERYLRLHQLVAKERQHPAAFTAHQLAEVEHLPEAMVAKTVFFWCDDQLVMGVVPANRHLNLARVRKQTHAARVRLATEREIADHVSTLQLGSIPPFGSMFGLPVMADKSLLEADVIEVPAGLPTEALKLRLRDWLRAEAPDVVELTRRPIRTRGAPKAMHAEIRL
jgi:Ala-tRNA(Pro) deacylase